MKQYVTTLAREQEWDNTTAINILCGVLDRLVSMGAADKADLEALVRMEANLGTDIPKLHIGDKVVMDGTDAIITVTVIMAKESGKTIIVDQYGDRHEVEHDGDRWVVIIPAL